MEPPAWHRIYSQVGRTADAERLLEKVVAADPRRRDDVQMMGELHMRDKDYQGAFELAHTRREFKARCSL